MIIYLHVLCNHVVDGSTGQGISDLQLQVAWRIIWINRIDDSWFQPQKHVNMNKLHNS